MKKSFIHLFLSLVLFSSIFISMSCSTKNPEQTVKSFLSSMHKEDYTSCYSLLSKSDKEVKSFDVFNCEVSNEFGLTTSKVRKETTWEITSTVTDSNKTKSTVTVDFTYPDYTSLLGEILLSSLQESLINNLDTEEIKKDTSNKINNSDVPTSTKSYTFTLLFEDKEWKLFFDYKTKEKIIKLTEEGEALYNKENWTKALEIYNELYQLDNSVDTKALILDLEQKIKDEKEKKDYLPKVEVYALNAKLHDNYLGKKEAGVTFKVKNNGNKTLTNVTVTVYFKNNNGEVIKEVTYNPISEYNFYTSDKVLKPNHIWQMDDYMYYQASGVPSEWKEGSAYAKVTDIEFQ